MTRRYKANLQVPKPSSLLEHEPILPTFYWRSGTEVWLAEEEPNFLVISHPKARYADSVIDLTLARAVLAFGNVDIDPLALTALLQHQVPVVFFTDNGEVLGRLEPTYTSRPDIIRAQSLMTEAQQLHLTQMATWGILRRCRKFLLRSIREGQDKENFVVAIQQLDFAIDAIFKYDSVTRVQGLLGAGLKEYYPALAKCIRNPGWQYSGRNTMEPFNRLLNFAYSLVEQSAKSALALVGLNPAYGFWHSTRAGQQGLVADLVSEFKSYADAVVLRAINRGQIVLKDFDGDWWHTQRLPPSATNALVNSYERKMQEVFTYPFTKIRCTYQEAIYLQAKQIALYLCGEIEEYFSLTLK